jgi:hypothetical protein
MTSGRSVPDSLHKIEDVDVILGRVFLNEMKYRVAYIIKTKTAFRGRLDCVWARPTLSQLDRPRILFGSKFQLHGPISEGQHLRVEQEHVTEPCFLSYAGSVFRFTETLAEIVDPVVIAVPAIVD